MGLTAADVMTSRVVTLSPDMNLIEMDTVLVKRGISGAPVVERQKLVGLASQADIVRVVWEEHHAARSAGGYDESLYPIPISTLASAAKEAPQIGARLVEQTVRDVMTKDPLVAHPETPIEEIAERMVGDQIHRIPITDRDNGELVGLVSALDIVRAVTRYGLG
jgi:CBS domain-containing protein